ncbi:MAG: hypothetical protein IJ959_01540, partial [Clostridia bacterium]|nr:hypothetical protein [Clostridia bacterium]
MESIWEIVVSNGIFAALFVWLLFYQLKDSARREKKYIDIIDKLSVQLDVIENIEEDVKEIKNILAKCEDEDEKDKTIKKWSNARHGIVFDNFDICFGDKELQQIL